MFAKLTKPQYINNLIARSFSQYKKLELTIIDYKKLTNEQNLHKEIENGFGKDGPGLLVVKNIPEYTEARMNLLPLAQKLANLPKDQLKKYEIPEAFYAIGWSHGKEQFQGQYDFSKGSFYANPIYDQQKYDPEAVKIGNSSAPNVWPSEIKELEPAFKKMGQVIKQTATHLSKHIDSYLHKQVPNIEPHKFEKMTRDTTQFMGRLLHYFPVESTDNSQTVVKGDEANWCGWHNDHGALTGLTSAIYLDKSGKVVDFADEESGLFIRNRQGDVVKAAIPKDCLAFQLGETLQILSGGSLIATPHCVIQGNKMKGLGLSRNTFACFMAPEWNEPMKVPAGKTREDAFVKGIFGVPKLQDRWKDNHNYFQFSNETIKYYN
jgi:isopenicillin N synthase-like dioxygenase